jgi:hypothetical protein
MTGKRGMVMKEWIEQYAAGFERLSDAIAGLSLDQLNFKPSPEAWSVKEIAVHLADTEIVAVYRMKAVLSETNPTLLNFDQDNWAARLRYSEADMGQALEQFKVLRESFLPTLTALKDADWERIGTHNQVGVLTMAQLLEKFVRHVDTHLDQIQRNLAAFEAVRGN